MAAIDEKIVKMSVDNATFMSKLKASLTALLDFNKSLRKADKVDLSGIEKGMNKATGSVQKASTGILGFVSNMVSKLTGMFRGVDTSTLENGVNQIASRFTNMGVVATTVLQNITNRITDAGMNMAKALTVQPAIDGFNEYELKMKSIQTILSNTKDQGTTLDDVTASLNDLNTYADKTIYSFADMTSNIGSFTAAGVSLKDSQTAIKGISNLAAASGSNTQQASTAMYQLSQALASGKVGLQDWNSVVNAGMGGKLFQNALEKTAKELGHGKDEAVSFRDSLQDGWLTSDVLLKTLDQFSKDQSMLEAATKVRTFSAMIDTAKEAMGSGWATTWEKLVGNFQQAGDLFTAASDKLSGWINKSSDARNKMVTEFVNLGGREQIIQGLTNVFKSLEQVVTLVAKAFRLVFPPKTAQDFMNMAKAFNEFTKKMILGEGTASKLLRVFQGFFSVFGIVIDLVKMTAKAIGDIIPNDAGSKVLDFLFKIGDMIVRFRDALNASNGFATGIGNSGEAVVWFANAVKKAFSSISAFGKALFNITTAVFGAISPIFGKLADAAFKLVKSFDFNDLLNVGLLVGLNAGIKKINKFGDVFAKALSSITGSFKGLMDSGKDAIENLGGIKDALQSMTTAVKATTLIQIALAVGILALSMKTIADIDAQSIFKSLEVIGVVLIGLTQSLNVISKLDFKGSMIKGAIALQSISNAILIISFALKVMSTIKPEEMMKSLGALTVTIVELVAAMVILGKFGGKIGTSSLAIITLATSVVILAGALKILATISVEDTIKSLSSLGVLFLEIATFSALMTKSKIGIGNALSIMVIASSLVIMSAAVALMGAIDTGTLIKGLTAIGVILLEIGAFSMIVDGSKMMGASVAITIMAAAIGLLVGPVTQLGSLSMEQLAKGIGSMGVALVMIGVALKATKGSLLAASSIAVVAGALTLLIVPITAIGNLPLSVIAIGLGTMAVSLGLVALAANLIGVGGAVALFSFAAAIGAVGLVIIGIGAAFAGFSAALVTLATLTAASVASIVTTLGLLIIGVASILPDFFKMVGTAITEFVKMIANIAPTLAENIAIMIVKLLETFNTYLPQIVRVGSDLVINLANAISEKAPELVNAGVQLIVTLINGLANAVRDNAQQIVMAVMNITEALLEVVIIGLNAIIQTMFGWIPGVSQATANIGDAAMTALRGAFSPEASAAIASQVGSNYATGLSGKSGDANAAGTNVGSNAKAGTESINLRDSGVAAGNQYTQGVADQANNSKNAGQGVGSSAKGGAGSVNLRDTGVAAGNQYVGGIGNANSGARGAGSSLSNAGKGGAGSVSWNDSGAFAGEGFAQGIESKKGRAESAGSMLGNIAKTALNFALKIMSPSRELMKSGGWFGEGFAIGIDKKQDRAAKAGTNIGAVAKDAVLDMTSGLSSLIDQNMEMNPVVKPVMDLSNVRSLNLDATIQGASAIRAYNANTYAPSTRTTSNNQNDNISSKILNKLDDVTTAITSRPLQGVVNMDGRAVGMITAPAVAEAQAKREQIQNLINGKR